MSKNKDIKKIIQILKNTTVSKDKLPLLLDICNYYQGINDFQNTEKYLNQFKKYLKETNDEYYLLSAFIIEGNLFLEKGEFNNALKKYFQAEKIAQDMKDYKNLCVIYSNIAVIYIHFKQEKKAIEYNLRLEDILLSENGENDKLLSVYNNIGASYNGLKEYDKALYYLKKALTISKENKDKKIARILYHNIADSYSALKEISLAQEYYFRSLNLSEETDDIKGIVLNLIKLSKIFRASNEIKKADEFEQKAIELAKTLKNKTLLSNIYKIISDYYKYAGNFDMSVKYYKKFKRIR